MARALPILVLVVIAAPARASQDVPRQSGMYTGQGAALAMLDSDVRVHVRGPVVEAMVTQTFRNDTDHVTEATYIFPLPADAAVSAMQIETGARTIHAAIETRERAVQRYEAAVAAGVGAGLLEQERPDIFTQTVSAIPAHATVKVTLRFDTVAHYARGSWELALPLVVAPRYVPGSATGRPTTGTGRAPDTDRAPDASRVTPGGEPGAGGATTVTLTVDDATDVASPTHTLTSARDSYTLVDPKSDHDIVVRWRSTATQRAWVEKDGTAGVAAVLVEAKAPATRKGDLRIQLVLDRAATTRGDGELIERTVVRALLAHLTARDRIAVTGSDTVAAATPDAIGKVLDERWRTPAGAFDLTKTLSSLHDGPFVLVTDGLVADDRAALDAASSLGAPLFVIGIGPAPNRGLLDRLAAVTGGTVRYATIGDDTSALARDVIADLASPPSPVAITWGTLVASDVVPATLPRIGAGQALLVLAKVTAAQAANARARGDVFAFTVTQSPAKIAGATSTDGPFARRWAKQKLDDLVATGAASTAIAEHALRHGLVSPMTAMVAIGDETVIEGGVKHTVPVPVSVPAGMRWQLVKQETTVAVSESGETARDEADDEDTKRSMETPMTDLLSESVAIRGVRRGYRLSLALGGGLAYRGGESAALASIAGRVELGRHLTLVGLEAGLSLVDGLHGQGSALLSLTQLGLARRVEVGLGGGIRFTDALVGPALDLTVRYVLPFGYDVYLRYDGALLSGDALHLGSAGVEVRW